MKPHDRDLSLKLATKLLFEQLGYVAEIAVQIASRSYQTQYSREQLSDFDVLGLKFERDLYLQKIAAECKSGESKALEELLKLKGILVTFQIHRGYFVKTRVHQNAREVAARINVTVFDEEELKELLATAFGMDVAAAVGKEAARYRATEDLNTIIQQQFRKVCDYLRFEFWNLEPYRNLHNLMKLVSTLRETMRDSEVAHRYLFCRLLYYLTLTVTQLAGKVLATSFRNPGRGLAVCIFGGPRERREREILFDYLNRVVAEQARSIPKFEPEFLGGLSEVVLRLIRSAPAAAEVPAFVRGVIDERFTGGAAMNLTQYDTVARKLSQDICLFLIRETGLSKSFGLEILEY